MPIIIDPNIREIPDNHQVFVLHPGFGKKFYNDFVQQSVVFLDLPGMKFKSRPKAEDVDLRNQLRMSKRIALWRRANSPSDNAPSREPNDYAVANNSSGKSTPRFVTEVTDLYADAKKGDLVVVPGKGYGTPVYIGEFTEDLDTEFMVQSNKYPHEKIPARKVRWLSKGYKKYEFGQRLIKLMQNRQALIRIKEKSDLRDVYEIVFGNYIWGEVAGNLLRVSKPEVDQRDLAKAMDLTDFFVAQYTAMERGELQQFAELSFHEAIEKFYDANKVGGIEVEIHSPGHFLRVIKDAGMASFVVTMVALSASGVSAEDAKGVEVSNSSNIEKSICDKKLESDIREAMEVHANMNSWETEVCKRSQDAKNSLGFDSKVKVKQD